jgi:hypothetical protein
VTNLALTGWGCYNASAGGGEPCDGGWEKMGLGRKWGEMKMGITGMSFES